MVFRAVDIDGKGVVNWLDFVNFLREVLRTFYYMKGLSSSFTNPLMKVLDPSDSTQVTHGRYNKFLQCFML